MTNKFKNKVVVITGASSGIGKATAVAFASMGAIVVLASRSEEQLRKVEQEINVFNKNTLVIPVDTTKKDEVKNLIDRSLEYFRKIDVFVNNAGIYFRCPARDLKIDDIERVMAVNFYGYIYGILEVLPHMLEQKIGHIVVVSSMDGKKGIPPDSAYVASKFAITGFSEVLRQELKGTGVHISTIFPGRVDTPMLANLTVPVISAKISPTKVAKAIINAVLKNKSEIFVPYFTSKFLIFLNCASPRLGDLIVKFFHLEGRKE